MLDGIKGMFKKGATAVAKKVAKTDYGIAKMKEEMAKMPIPPQMKMMFTKLLDNNPDLLFKIQEEIQELISKGKNQMAASQTVMTKYQQELRDAMK